jgi:hypothetical protein
MNMAHTLDCGTAELVGSQLVAALQAFRGGSARVDDETIIAVRMDDSRAR